MSAGLIKSHRYLPVTVKKAFRVLHLCLEEREGLGTSEIARRLSLPKSTAFGILEDLTKEGWISKDPVRKKYALGAELVALAKTISLTGTGQYG